MALRWFDSFDHYASADISKKYGTTVGSPVIGATGRNGTNGCRLNGSGTRFGITLDSQSSWIVGAAFSFATFTNQTVGFIRLLDAGTLHVDCRVNASGVIQITRNGTVLGTCSSTLLTSVFYYIEFVCNISDTAGAPAVYVNGVAETITWVTGTSTTQDTRNGANASANTIEIGGQSANTDVDDFYICDGTGSSPYNTVLGDCRVEAIFPTGNGNSSVLVGSDGNSTDNYLLVDETTPATADYVESSTPGDKDTYAYGNLTATSGTVYGVAVRPYAAKTDAGSRSIVTVARVSSTEVDSSALTLSTTAAYLLEAPRTTKPGGGSWSVSDVNGAEFGVKVNA